MQSIPASSIWSRVSSAKQWAVTRAPSSWAACTASLTHGAGKRGREVAGVAVDPVPHELDPAVTGPGLLPHRLHQILRLHLDGEVPAGSGGSGRCAGPARMIRGMSGTALQPAGVTGRAGVADQQRAGVAVGPGLRLGHGVRHVAAGAQADVAMGVDEPGKHPAIQHDVRRGGRTVEGQPPVHGPESVAVRVRPGEDGSAELDDVWPWPTA